MDTSAKRYCVYDHSGVLRFLFGNHNKWSSAVKVLAIMISTVALCLLAGFLDGTWRMPGPGYGVLEDFGTHSKVLVYTFCILLSRGLFNRIPQTFMGSEWRLNPEAGLPQMVDFSDGYVSQYTCDVQQWMSFIDATGTRPRACLRVLYMFFVAMMLVSYGYVACFQHPGGWNFDPYNNPFGYLACMLQDCVLYLVIIPPILWRVVGTMLACNGICKKLSSDGRLKVNPISPDGAGGLGALGTLSLLMTYIVAAPVVFLVCNTLILGFNIAVVVAIPFYSLLIVVTFFLPLSSAHNAMKEAKNREMAIISNLFNSLHSEFHALADRAEKARERSGMVEEMETLSQLYRTAAEMPLWPFDISTMKRFLTVVLLPIAVFLISMIANADSVLYHLDDLFKLVGRINATE